MPLRIARRTCEKDAIHLRELAREKLRDVWDLQEVIVQDVAARLFPVRADGLGGVCSLYVRLDERGG